MSNKTAINMYYNLGYIVYRRITDYYSSNDGNPDEDAFGESLIKIYQISLPGASLDMRKALSRDVEKKSVIPLKNPVPCSEVELD